MADLNVEMEERYGVTPQMLFTNKDYTFEWYAHPLGNSYGVVKLPNRDSYGRKYDLHIMPDHDIIYVEAKKNILYETFIGTLRMLDIGDAIKAFAINFTPELDSELLLRLQKAELDLVKNKFIEFKKQTISTGVIKNG